MDLSPIKDLSLGIIIGPNDLDLKEIYKAYNERIEALMYFNKINLSKSISKYFNKFDSKPLDNVISKYWGKTIDGIKCGKYTNLEGKSLLIFGLINELNINGDDENLFIVYSEINLYEYSFDQASIMFLKKSEVEQIMAIFLNH